MRCWGRGAREAGTGPHGCRAGGDFRSLGSEGPSVCGEWRNCPVSPPRSRSPRAPGPRAPCCRVPVPASGKAQPWRRGDRSSGPTSPHTPLAAWHRAWPVTALRRPRGPAFSPEVLSRRRVLPATPIAPGAQASAHPSPRRPLFLGTWTGVSVGGSQEPRPGLVGRVPKWQFSVVLHRETGASGPGGRPRHTGHVLPTRLSGSP